MWPEGVVTDNTDDNHANDNDNARWTIHDNIGSLIFMPNEPIIAIK